MDDQQELATVQATIRRYVELREELRRLGVLRNGRSVEGEYAEWLAARMFGLELCASTVEKGFDATDADGKTVQIKSRVVWSLTDNASFDITDPGFRFDYLVGVFFSRSLEVLAVVRVPYGAVIELGSQTRSTFRLRWNKRTRSDPRVERLFPDEDEGR